ncbi:hypothetical protein CLAFUR4_02897 [Fulvia fulva]|nr:hypothetical protein CLAFUR4_02897 [Fulvia fulva]WPV26225.1 hypothetical protein CLAFUW7_02901 [Fulvia fulva]
MGLYLGRTPVLPDAPNFNPPMLDEAAEDRPWAPCFRGEDDGPWPPMLSHSMSAFVNSTKLHVIVNDLFSTVYSRKVPADPLPYVQQTRQKLEAWRAASASHLIMLPGASHCPPVHIVLQNLLYYAATILLHRPFRNSAACRTACREAADEIQRITCLYEKNMGLSHVLYLMAYATYIAATVTLLMVHDGVEGARAKVDFFLHEMHACRSSCPAIQKSIDIIVQGPEPRPVRTATGMNTPAVDVPRADQHPLPAFPFEQQHQHMQPLWTGGDGGMGALPSGGLDPFALEWSQLPIDAFENFL